jgi:putative ABC transport system permease protein
MISLAALELNATATRSIALIAVAALAVYGSVAIQGARADLSSGLDEAVVEYLDTAQVWVAANDKFLTVDSFKDDGAAAAIARAPGVAAVRVYEGGLLNVGSRSLWIRARSPLDDRMIQKSQLLEGNLAHGEALIRRGSWAAISRAFAAERHLHVGERFTLPTPTGVASFGVAAITTNTGWSPGAITINLNDYRRLWDSYRPAALEVQLKPGVSPAAGRRSVIQALKGRPGLRVQTLSERVASFQSSAREGLRSLGQISALLLITAALAVAAVLSASIWQRRPRLASLAAQGFDHMQLWRAVAMESAVAVAIGCAVGALLGLYGHALASRWLELSTGFPAPFSLGLGAILEAFAIVAGCTVLMVGVLGYRSARVPPSVAFQDQP